MELNKYNKKVFSSGLRLITAPIKNSRTITVLVLVKAGSKYETEKNNGVSHFLEHMFFKGTKKRPTTLDIAESLDSIGGEYNAFTGTEYTGYWAKTDKKYLDLSLDWISDIFLNSKLNSKDIEKEKGVIIEEINMYLDTPSRYVRDLWEKLLYKNQPAGWSILGEKDNVTKMSRSQIMNYLKDHYVSYNVIVSIAGNSEKIKDAEEKVKKCFKNISKNNPKPKKKVVEKQEKPQVLIKYKDTDQAHLCLGVRGYDIFDSRKYAQSLLSVILGGNMSSRLWSSIRVKNGMAYYIRTLSEVYTDHGYLLTHAGVDNKKIEKAIKLIIEQYKQIADKKIDKKELEKAKDYIKGSAILHLESSNEIADFIGSQEILTNEILTLKQKFDKIEAVTIDELYEIAKDLFRPENLNLALIGPFKKKKKFEELLII